MLLTGRQSVQLVCNAAGVIPCSDKCGHYARTYRKGAWAAPNDRGAVAADKRNETFLRAGSYYQQMAGSINL